MSNIGLLNNSIWIIGKNIIKIKIETPYTCNEYKPLHKLKRGSGSRALFTTT